MRTHSTPFLKRFITLTMAIVLLLMAFTGCGKSDEEEKEEAQSSYNDAIETYLAVRYEGNVRKLEKLAPREYWDYIEEIEGMTLDEIKEEYEEEYKDYIVDELEDEFGENIRVSFEVVEEEPFPADIVEILAEELNDRYGIEKKRVQAAAGLTVECTIRGSEEKETDEEEKIVVKIGSDWYILDLMISNFDPQESMREAVIEEFIDFCFLKDRQTVTNLQSLLPAETMQYFQKEYDVDADDLLLLHQQSASLQDELAYFGDNLRYELTIYYHSELDSYDLEDIEEDLEEYYNLDLSKIEEAYEVELEVEVEGDDDWEDYDGAVVLFRIGSQWYMEDALAYFMSLAAYR